MLFVSVLGPRLIVLSTLSWLCSQESSWWGSEDYMWYQGLNLGGLNARQALYSWNYLSGLGLDMFWSWDLTYMGPALRSLGWLTAAWCPFHYSGSQLGWNPSMTIPAGSQVESVNKIWSPEIYLRQGVSHLFEIRFPLSQVPELKPFYPKLSLCKRSSSLHTPLSPIPYCPYCGWVE